MMFALAILSTVFLSVSFIIQKRYQQEIGDSAIFGTVYNFLVAALTAVLFFAICGFRLSFSWYSLLMSSLSALVVFLYIILSFRIMEMGQMVLYTVFLMAGGMIVPYVYGLFFLDETFSVLRLIGLVAITVAVVLSAGSIPESSPSQKKVLFLCVAVFFLNGINSVLNKLHQINTLYDKVDSVQFTVYANFTRLPICLLLLAVLMAIKKVPVKKAFRQTPVSLVCTVLFSLFNGMASFLLVYTATDLPATVLYPITTGGCILFTGLFAWLFFHERPTPPMWASLVLCFVGTFLFL